MHSLYSLALAPATLQFRSAPAEQSQDRVRESERQQNAREAHAAILCGVPGASLQEERAQERKRK